MPDWSPSRRTVLRTGGALGVAALAGCLGGSGGGSPLDVVPSDVSIVLHADVETLLADDVFRARLDETLRAAADEFDVGPGSLQATLDRLESDSGLDPRAISTMTVFGGFDPGGPAGARIQADWTESAVRDALVGGAAETTSYNDRTVYRAGERTALGVLGDGVYVTGSNTGVEAAIDVADGDADPVGGRIREAFTAAPDGPLRFSFEVPADPGWDETESSPVDPSAFDAVTHGYGGYAVEGEERLTSITLEAESADAAERVLEQLRSARDLARQQLEPADSSALRSDLDGMLAALDIDAVGSSVTVTLDEGEDFVLLLMAAIAAFTLGFGDQPEPRVPQAAFRFRYEADAGRLSIVHRGGDHVTASALRVRGSGLANGTWAELGGTTSGDVGGQPAITAGDTLTVDADADYEVQLVWADPDGDTSAVLAADTGPGA